MSVEIIMLILTELLFFVLSNSRNQVLRIRIQHEQLLLCEVGGVESKLDAAVSVVPNASRVVLVLSLIHI